VTNSFESSNEAFSRTVLHQILICSLYEEGKESIKHLEQVHDPKEIPHGHPHTPATRIQESLANLELMHEMPLSKLVMPEGESKLLLGFADYSIWYESATNKTMATNLFDYTIYHSSSSPFIPKQISNQGLATEENSSCVIW